MTARRVLYPPVTPDEVRRCDGGVRLPEITEPAWMMSPELELSIDVETTRINVRLVGTLDSQTGKEVRSVIEELVQDGYRDFAMQVEALRLPEPAGFSSLVGIQRLIKSVGGSIKWSRWRDPTG